MESKVAREAIFKSANAAKQLVYGVVLEPDTFDDQEDLMTADEVEKTAHGFLRESRMIADTHAKDPNRKLLWVGPEIAELVESFIAPVTYQMGEETITKGSWVIAVRVNDKALWQDIEKGEYTGFSIDGSGYRTEIED